jgi:carbamoylphosphate synthase small subunit
MAWMNQERKAKIVTAMKPIMRKYGIKGTFKCDTRSITFTIREGAVDFIGDMQDTPSHRVNRDNLRTRYNFSVNPYWYNEHYTGTSKDLLDEVMTAMKGADWYDRSDIQTDYFDTAYYYDVNVGSWQKPYTLTK